MADTGRLEDFEKFAPKDPPKLSPPKDDLINVHHLAKCDGTLHSFYLLVRFLHRRRPVCADFLWEPDQVVTQPIPPG